METGDSSNIIGSLVEGHPLEARTPIMLELSPDCAPAAARGPIASHIERVGGAHILPRSTHLGTRYGSHDVIFLRIFFDRYLA